jgi:hypothetical protein
MSDIAYNCQLMSKSALKKYLLPVAIGLLVGAVALPALIFGVGVAVLGPYDGGSLAGTYKIVLGGLVHGSVASWIVVLGPYLLWHLARLLRYWWRASAKAF